MRYRLNSINERDNIMNGSSGYFGNTSHTGGGFIHNPDMYL